MDCVDGCLAPVALDSKEKCVAFANAAAAMSRDAGASRMAAFMKDPCTLALGGQPFDGQRGLGGGFEWWLTFNNERSR